jgi:hypothetical protein
MSALAAALPMPELAPVIKIIFFMIGWLVD